MDNILERFIYLFIIFCIILLFFLPIAQRVESLEKLHNEYVCFECNSLVKK